jgi:23S rRNA (uridine2552-2'-O)-methyltransferase
MANPADQRRFGASSQVGERQITILARQPRQADLDQFVIQQRALCLGDDAVTDAGIADQDHGLEGVGEAAQVAALFFGKLHGLKSTAFPMPKRTRSSHAWLKEHFTDPYVQRAKAEGWRSRAIYKLEEMDRREKLIRPGMVVLDLGAAPGGWSQYARRKVGRHGRIVAMDILPMDALVGVEFLQGDFREDAVLDALIAQVGERGVDVLLSDIAPNLSGMDAIDQPRSMYLVELALDMAQRVLKPGGTALIKTFQGAGFHELVVATRKHYERVKLLKPDASRARSPELYLLATGFRMV